MRVSHSHTETDTTPRTDARAALQRLQREVVAKISAMNEVEDFERFEREVHALFVTVEREVLGDGLSRLDVDVPAVVIEGRVHHRVLRGTESYTTAVGPVTVERTLYRVGKERAVVPLELRAGIIAGHWTPLAARQGAFLVAHLTPQDSENTLRELGNMTPSKSSLDRLVKVLSGDWEDRREAFEAHLREAIEVPSEAVTIAVSLDGVMTPMKDGERADKREQAREQGKQTKGPAGYQEAGCATFSFFDVEGERLATTRYARMPESKKATLKNTLSADVKAVLAQRPELRLVKLADGAKDNWTYLSEELPDGDERIDFFHAAENLQAVFDNAYGQRSAKAHSQFEKYRHILRHDDDGVEAVIRALKYLHSKHPRCKRLKQTLGYFRRNRKRMGYAQAKAQNLPIGSGVVEAACKTLVTQRMKCSGMRWRHAGGQAILTLRSQIQSNRFEQAWELLSDTYRVSVSMPKNVVPLPWKRAA